MSVPFPEFYSSDNLGRVICREPALYFFILRVTELQYVLRISYSANMVLMEWALGHKYVHFWFKALS